MVTSGRTEAAQAQKDRLRKYLLQHTETQLASLAYTTTARRMHHNLRDACVTTFVAELLCQMGQPAKSLMPALAVVFAFAGQGSHYAGMGGTMYRISLTLGACSTRTSDSATLGESIEISSIRFLE